MTDWINSAEHCRKNGWGVGTSLIGDEGYGPAVIEITAIGETRVLAKAHIRQGKPVKESESLWNLSCRDWREVPQ